MRGKGIASRLGTGNLYVTVSVEIPTKLSKAQKQKMLDFDEDVEIKQYDKMKKYSDAIQSLYGDRPYQNK